MEDYATIENAIFSVLTSSGITVLMWLMLKEWLSSRIRSSIKHDYDKELETFKAQLNYENEEKLDKVKASLRASLFEQQQRSVRIIEKRAEVMSEVYYLLHTISIKAYVYTNVFGYEDDPPKCEKRENVTTAFKEFHEYYIKNKLWIPKRTCELINSFENKINDVVNDHFLYVEQKIEPKKRTIEWSRTWKTMKNEIGPLLDSLDEDFRIVIGDNG